MRTRVGIGLVLLTASVVLGASPALACGGLVAPNGSVHLLRTTTLAAWHDGVEHYITSFQFAGGGAEFGSIVPLPGVPTKVERAGGWTLQRLERETTPPPEDDLAFNAQRVTAAAGGAAVELFNTTVDALDLTVLSGGGQAVGDWARQHGFQLTPDTPELLDYYAKRSPIFLAARFNPAAAAARGQQNGDGTPIDLTIPLPNPWVPLRILGLGRGALEPISADVYLLTDHSPTVLPTPSADNAMSLFYSAPASASLLSDLRADKNMGWIPASGWLTELKIDGPAYKLDHDLAIDATGGARPSLIAAGLRTGQPASALPAALAGRVPNFDADEHPLVTAGRVALAVFALLIVGAFVGIRRLKAPW
jgi:hypothetical protein